MFSYVSCEARVPTGHPLRVIRAIVDEALDVMSAEFEGLYARVGRPSIPPEKLLRALLLQDFYGVRSERQLMEQRDYNLLFRWFVGLAMDAPVWDASTFSKNRDRLLAGDVAPSHKSFQPKPGDDPDEPPASGSREVGHGDRPGRNGERDWRGQKRSNQTHASTTDPDARPARTSDGQPSILAYAGHVLMENRNGLVRAVCLNHASGTAERDAALALVSRRTGRSRITLGADKGYDAAAFIAALRARSVTPPIAIDARTSKLGTMRLPRLLGCPA